MAESSLSVGKSELDEYIAHFLGYGRTSGNWTTAQSADINQARDAGLARFYNERDWNFLNLPTTLSISAAGDYDLNLPDDFGAMSEDFYFAADKGHAPLVMRSVGYILNLINRSDSNGIPMYYALRAKSQTGAAGTRWEALIYPPPDDTYTLYYRYMKLRDALTSTYPYPAGGMQTREALIAACLAEADRLFNDSVGIQEATYQERLVKAKQADARTRPNRLGQMTDSSDASPRGRYDDAIFDCTINGSVPS